MAEKKYKHCMLGEMGVGKTCIVLKYVDNVFDPNTSPTLGVNFLTKTVKTQGKTIEFNIWDTAGSERFRSMVSMYYRGVTSCMIVYDITNRESFEDVEGWYQQVKAEADNPNVVVAIVGTKIDLADKRQVSTEEGQAIATKLGCIFGEVTAATGDSIDKIFEKIISEMNLTTAPPVIEQTPCC